MTYGSPLVRKEIASRVLTEGHASVVEHTAQLKAQLQLFIERHANAYAYGDTFKIFGIITIVAIVSAWFIRYSGSSEGSGQKIDIG